MAEKEVLPWMILHRLQSDIEYARTEMENNDSYGRIAPHVLRMLFKHFETELQSAKDACNNMQTNYQIMLVEIETLKNK